MEAPPAQRCSLASLKELAAKTIVASKGFPMRYPMLATLADDYKDSVNEQLFNTLESKFFSEDKRDEKILFGGHGSRCAFLADEKFIACYKQKPLEIDILNLETFYRDRNHALLFRCVMDDYRQPFFIASSRAHSKYQGAFYTLDRKGINTYKIYKNFSPAFVIKTRRMLYKDPLPGKVRCIKPSGTLFLIQTRGGGAKDQEYFFAIDQKGCIQFMSSHSNKIPITKIIPGPCQTNCLIFSNGDIQIFDPATKTITSAHFPPEHPFTIPELYHSSVTASPDQKKIYTGFGNGKLQEYNARTQSVRTYFHQEDNYPFGPIIFLDTNLFLTARHFPHRNTNKQAGWLELWHITPLQPIAFYQHDDPYYCNSIQIDAQRKNILLGMGMYDATALTLDSFTFIPDVMDPDQIYKQPQKLVELLEKQHISFKDKVEFLLHYLKK